MAYAFTFATKAAYTAAKQSGGSIYNALIPSSSTGGTTNVSRSAVSFIAELGRAVVDSVNLCVPYKEGGFVGDNIILGAIVACQKDITVEILTIDNAESVCM